MKKVLSIVLALAMCMSMATFFTVSAESNPQWWAEVYTGTGSNNALSKAWTAPVEADLASANEFAKDDTFTVRVGLNGLEENVNAFVMHVRYDDTALEYIPWDDSNKNSYMVTVPGFGSMPMQYAGDKTAKAYTGLGSWTDPVSYAQIQPFGDAVTTGNATMNQGEDIPGYFCFTGVPTDGVAITPDMSSKETQTIIFLRFKVIAEEGVNTEISISKTDEGSACDPWQRNMEDRTVEFALNGGASDEPSCTHECTIPGEVIKAPTAKETGLQEYVCECGEESIEVELPVLTEAEYFSAEATVSATAPEADTVSIKVVAGIAAPDFDAAGFLLEGDKEGAVCRYYIENAYTNYAEVDGLAITLKINDVPNIDKVLKITPFTVLDGVETYGEAYSFNISDAFAG